MANIFHNAFNFMTPGRKSSSDRGQEIVLGKKHSVKNRSHLKSYNSTPLDAATWDCHSFINAIIQMLWHNDVFRMSFLKFKGHSCDGDSCTFCALKVIFNHFQHTPLSNYALSEAMIKLQKITNILQFEGVEDAVECFEVILEHIHYSLTGNVDLDDCSKPWCVSHQKFFLSTIEQNVCQCRAQSVPLPYMEFVNYITVSELLKESKRLRSQFDQAVFDKSVFDLAICATESSGGELRCPSYPNCHKKAFTRRALLNSPDMICIGFVWDRDDNALSESFVRTVMEAIDTNIKPRKLFDQVISDNIRDTEFTLTAMITYSESHYSPFCFHTHKDQWLHFNDSSYKEIGSSWKSVVDECCRQLLQPLLLVFSNPNGTAIDATNAPNNVTVAPPREEYSSPRIMSHTQQITSEAPVSGFCRTQLDLQFSLPVCPIEITEIAVSSNPPSPIPSINITANPSSNPSFHRQDLVSSSPSSPVLGNEKIAFSNPSSPVPHNLAFRGTLETQISTLPRNIKLSPQSIPKSMLSKNSMFPQTSAKWSKWSTHKIESSTLTRSTAALYSSEPPPTPPRRQLRASQSMVELKQSTPSPIIKGSQSVAPHQIKLSKQSSISIVSQSTPSPIIKERSQSVAPQQTKLLQQSSISTVSQSTPSPIIKGRSRSLAPHETQQSTSIVSQSTINSWLTRRPLPQIPQCTDIDPITDAFRPLPDAIVRHTNNVHGGRRGSSPFPMANIPVLQFTRTDSVEDRSSVAIETKIRELPKHVCDALLHCGLCIAKINQSNDPIVSAILLDLAVGQIHGAMNQPSVSECQQLFIHLNKKKIMLQMKFMSLMSKLNQARLDPMTLKALSSNEDISIERFFSETK